MVDCTYRALKGIWSCYILLSVSFDFRELSYYTIIMDDYFFLFIAGQDKA